MFNRSTKEKIKIKKSVGKILKQKSKTAIIAELRKEAEVKYENTYDKERILKTYIEAVKNTLCKIGYNKRKV